jgi:hypothetical protein
VMQKKKQSCMAVAIHCSYGARERTTRVGWKSQCMVEQVFSYIA